MIPANKIPNYDLLGNRLVGETHESRMRRVNAANHQTGLVGQAKPMPKIVGSRKTLQQFLGQTDTERRLAADKTSVAQYDPQAVFRASSASRFESNKAYKDEISRLESRRNAGYGDSLVWAGAAGLGLGVLLNYGFRDSMNKATRRDMVLVSGAFGAVVATLASKPNADATGKPLLGWGVLGVGAVAAIGVGLTSGWEQVQRKKGGWTGARKNALPVLGISAAAGIAAGYPKYRRFIAGGAVAAGAAIVANRVFETVSS